MISSRLSSPVRGRLRRLGALAPLALALALPAGAAATGTLDQQQVTDAHSAGFGVYGPTNRYNQSSPAQTFTAAKTGALDRVDLFAENSNGSATDPLTIELRNTVGGAPGAVLASATLPPASIPSTPDWVEVDFATPASVTSGSQYAIVAYTSGASIYTVLGSASDTYSGGDLWYSYSWPWTTWNGPIPYDFAFKTYVTTPTFAFTGFAAPIDNGIANSARAGKSIPVKWHLTLDGVPVSDPASFAGVSSQGAGGLCSGEPTDSIEEYATGSSGLQYLGNGDWQFNWSTPKSYAGQCRTMTLTLSDGTTHTASFQFK